MVHTYISLNLEVFNGTHLHFSQTRGIQQYTLTFLSTQRYSMVHTYISPNLEVFNGTHLHFSQPRSIQWYTLTFLSTQIYLMVHTYTLRFLSAQGHLKGTHIKFLQPRDIEKVHNWVSLNLGVFKGIHFNFAESRGIQKYTLKGTGLSLFNLENTLFFSHAQHS